MDVQIVDENTEEEPDTSVVAAAIDLEEAETSLDMSTGFEEASLFNTPRIEGVPITSASNEKVILHIIKAYLFSIYGHFIAPLFFKQNFDNFLKKFPGIKCQKYPSIHV